LFSRNNKQSNVYCCLLSGFYQHLYIFNLLVRFSEDWNWQQTNMLQDSTNGNPPCYLIVLNVISSWNTRHCWFWISSLGILALLLPNTFNIFRFWAEEARRFAHDTNIASILSITGCLRFSLKMDVEVKTSRYKNLTWI
jgi:hypothetical protein